MKIKEIKIRDDDGSYSDAIPVGVDAINADYNDTNVKDELDKLNNENNDRKNEINILNANDNSLQQQINTNKTNIELQASRIDNLATLQDGSTTGDAELIDGRIGYDGTQYTSLGDSIRTQIQDIYDTRDWMRINITNKDIENGTWENGVKVTYSIRLRSKEKYKVSAGDVVEWNMHGQGIGINLYAQEDGDNVIIDSGWRDGNSKWIIPQDGWIIFKFRKIDDSDIRAEEYVGRVSISKSFQSSDPIIAYGPAMSCYIGNNKEITCDKNSIYLYDTLMICTKDHGFAFGVSFDDMIASLGETVAIKENDILKIKMGSYQMLYFDLVDNKIKRKRAADAIKEASSIMPLAYSGGSGQLSGLLIDIATKLIVDKLPNKEWRYGTKVEVYIGNDKKIILTEHAGSNGGKIYLDFYDGIVLTLNNVGLGFSLDDILNALPDCTEMIDNKYLRLTLDSYDSLVYNTINKTLARRGTFSTIQTDDIVLMSNGWGNAASGKLLEVINKNQIKQINSKITELEHMKSTLPDYYLDEIKDTRYKLASLPSDNFNYLIITDIHYSRSEANQYKNMIQSLETLANGCNIDAVFFLGDLIEGGQSAPKDDSMALMSEAMEGFRQIRKPVLNAFGNHDHNQYNW